MNNDSRYGASKHLDQALADDWQAFKLAAMVLGGIVVLSIGLLIGLIWWIFF